MLKIIDIRGTVWFIRRTDCRHYQASRNGLNFTRCSVKSIATVMGNSLKLTRKLILGEM